LIPEVAARNAPLLLNVPFRTVPRLRFTVPLVVWVFPPKLKFVPELEIVIFPTVERVLFPPLKSSVPALIVVPPS
jgi:hypothetical protein